ncbi:MAG TPA: GlsB/YeaQ/YmgE family stress response membrane protein [Candidatus Limnocylindria bacterium]|nr:GlsB/YeaQ/YmgE family stress response membrane protein [Candidatus Limnocylindria bacterium]
MGIISWIILGALAGWIASKIMGRDAQMGAMANIVVGIVGALLGGFIMSLLGNYGVTGFDIRSFLVALGGAILLLAIFRGFRRGV